MDYRFEAIVTYDKEAVKHYTTYHYRHVDRRMPVGYILGGGLLLLVGLGVRTEWRVDIPFYLLLVVGVLLIAIGGNMLAGRASIRVQTQAGGQPLQNRLRFFDDRVEYAGPQSQGYYRYDQVTRVGEDPAYFFLYVDSNKALLIQKNGFTLGTPDQLRQFLLAKIPPRQA